MKKGLILFVIVFASYSQARKFSFQNESFAGYFRLSGAPSLLGKSVYENSSGSSTVFTDSVNYNYSGEIGFSFAPHDNFVLRVGWEGIQAAPQEEIAGKNASGTTLMTVTSSVLVVQPVATLEVNFFKEIESRFFAFLSTGQASLDIDNTYTFTAAGTTAYSTADYVEKSEASLLSTQYGIGYEMLMVDNVTATFELGYRNLNASSLTYRFDHTGAETTLQGDKVKGATVVNDDNSKRTANLSGYFLSIAFRFYIPTN